MRAGRWKAVRPSPRKIWELYDLKEDEKETTNLAASEPDTLQRLIGFAKEAHTEARAMPTVPRPICQDFKR